MQNNSLHPFKEVSEVIRKRRYSLMTRRGYWDLIRNILIMAILIFVVFTQIFMFSVANGTKMYPAILDGDLILGYRLDRNFIKNDVVICTVEDRQIIGRVVAKEGDTVNITSEGVLFVNGTEQKGEIAFPTYPGGQTFPYNVPKGHVYLLGDFRTQTYDSRDFGPVPVENVIAKVVSVIRRRGI